MSLTLRIVNTERLDNGEPLRLVLDRHGAVIGRSPHADWSLPDPKNHVSSTHCEVDFRDDAYVLIDKSTNGTFINGATERVAGTHQLRDGDEISIGPYRIEASMDGAAPRPPVAADPASGWPDWSTTPAPPDGAPPGWGTAPAPSPALPPQSGWPEPPAAAGGREISPAPGTGWDAPRPSTPAPAAAGWGPEPEPPQAPRPWAPEPAGALGDPDAAPGAWDTPGSAMSGRGAMSQAWPSPPTASSGSSLWDQMAATNEVDWDRAWDDAPPPVAGPRFTPQPDPTPTPIATTQPPTPPPAPPMPSPVTFAPKPPPAPAPRTAGDDAWAALVAAAGLAPEELRGAPEAHGAAIGALLRRMTFGLVVMMEARARAKAELGAQGTMFSPEGNNPLKFARTPDRALAQLVNPPERGFMPAERAVEDAFKDLQAHQMATLMAMQNALRATLERFSPQAIRERAESRGLLARIIPAAREAEMWKAYEREFEGVARGSDEAFMDVFAKAFREAYERASGGMR